MRRWPRRTGEIRVAPIPRAGDAVPGGAHSDGRSGPRRPGRAFGQVVASEPLGGVRIAGVLCWFWALAVIQAAVLARIPLPLGASAPVIVSVLALAHALGPVRGALFGAWAGLILDLVPPAAGPVGSWALILTAAGLVMGHMCEARQPGPWLAIGLVGVGTGAVVGARAVLLWFAGNAPALGPTLLIAAWAGMTAVILAPPALAGAQVLSGGRSAGISARRRGWAAGRAPGNPYVGQVHAVDPHAEGVPAGDRREHPEPVSSR